MALVLLFVMLGGAAGGGYWYWKQQQRTTLANNDPQQVDPDPTLTMQNMGVAMVEMVEPVMVEMVEPVMVEPIMVEMIEPVMVQMSMSMSMSMSGMSAAARAFVANGQAALASNNLRGAIESLRRGQRAVGANNSALRGLRRNIGQRGSVQVGNLMLRGNCAGAQQLYRQLRGVRAQRQSNQHFTGDWCSRP